jgi:hypothetical protein
LRSNHQSTAIERRKGVMKKYLFVLLLLTAICFASEKGKSAEEEKLEGSSQSAGKTCSIISCTTDKKPYAKMETRLQCDCDFKNTTLNELYQKGYKLVEILNQDTPVYYLEK